MGRRDFLRGVLGTAAIGSMGASPAEAKEKAPEDFGAFVSKANEIFTADWDAFITRTQAEQAAGTYELTPSVARQLKSIGQKLQKEYPQLGGKVLAFAERIAQKSIDFGMQQQWLDQGYYLRTDPLVNFAEGQELFAPAELAPIPREFYAPLEQIFSPEEVRAATENKPPVAIKIPNSSQWGFSDFFERPIINADFQLIKDIVEPYAGAGTDAKVLQHILMNETGHQLLKNIGFYPHDTVVGTSKLTADGQITQQQIHELVSDACSAAANDFVIGVNLWNLISGAMPDPSGQKDFLFSEPGKERYGYDHTLGLLLACLQQKANYPEIKAVIEEHIMESRQPSSKSNSRNTLSQRVKKIGGELLTPEDLLAIRKIYVREGKKFVQLARQLMADYYAKHGTPEQKK